MAHRKCETAECNNIAEFVVRAQGDKEASKLCLLCTRSYNADAKAAGRAVTILHLTDDAQPVVDMPKGPPQFMIEATKDALDGIAALGRFVKQVGEYFDPGESQDTEAQPTRPLLKKGDDDGE